MVASVNQTSLRLLSKPFARRTGLIPLIVAISLGWVFVVLWGGVLTVVAPHNLYWAMALGASTSAFSLFLLFMTYNLVCDAYREYIFELTDQEAVLIIVDKLRKKQITKMVLLNDVTYAEYYPYCDSSCVILHAPYIEMEVPLWPLGAAGKDVVDFLDGRGVRVMNVQLDDKIPE